MKTIRRKDAVIEEFNSVSEFVHLAETREENEYFKSRMYHLASKTNGRSFTGTNDYEEATELLRHGYKKGLKGLMETKTKLTQRENAPRPRLHADVVGFAPIVPNAIIGLPKSMIRREKIVQKAPVLNIIYDVTICGASDKKVLFEGGKNLLVLVKAIEADGYRVNLKVGYISSADRDKGQKYVSGLVTIKNAGQTLNPLLVSYPLTHPSFFRRHMFRWVETCSYTNHAKGFSGYGYVISNLYTSEKFREILKQKEIISNNDYYINAYESSRADSIEEMYKIMGLTK